MRRRSFVEADARKGCASGVPEGFVTAGAPPRVEWSASPADAVSIQTSYLSADASVQWHVLAPPSGGAIVLLELPAEWSELAPSTDALGIVRLTAIEASWISDYGAYLTSVGVGRPLTPPAAGDRALRSSAFAGRR